MGLLDGKDDKNTIWSGEQAGSNWLTADIGMKDSFWFTTDALPRDRWNKSYGFVFTVKKRTSDGKGYEQALVSDVSNKEASEASQAHSYARFYLPIPPESLSISTPFAINTSVTLGGIIEEHNAAPIKTITLSGSTGIFPLKGTAGNSGGGGSGFNNPVLSSGTQLASSGSHSSTIILTSPEAEENAGAYLSGHLQFLLFQRFLEAYALAKKGPKGRDLLLVFSIIKDKVEYAVTPQSFSLTRSASSPWEYNYSISMKAWARKKANAGALSGPFEQQQGFMDLVNKSLKIIKDAREVLVNLQHTIANVGADINRAVFEPIRQGALFCKDALGVGLAFSDLPVDVAAGAKDAIADYATIQAQADNVGSRFSSAEERARAFFEEVSDIKLNNPPEDVYEPGIGSSGRTREGRGTGARSLAVPPSMPGTSGASAFFSTGVIPLDVADLINVGAINATPKTTKAIGVARKEAGALGRADFERMRDGINVFANDFADSVGVNDPVYDAVYSRTAKNKVRDATNDDFEVLNALNNIGLAFDGLPMSNRTDRFRISGIQYIAGLARRSGIAFIEPKSKFLVPFPYGASLENLATRYLSNPDRWMEIAALNGLRAPYIDEEGFVLDLVTNGNGKTFFVNNSAHLYVGQPISIQSLTVNKSYRTITRIDRVSDTNYMITVDGDSDLEDDDLDGYVTTDSPVMHAYLPDTINSQQSLYIPSDIGVDEGEFQMKSIPGVDDLDPLFRVGGADLLMDADGDIVITEDSDCKLAVGLTNIIQKAQIRMRIPKGSLNRHPSVGLPSIVGESAADVDAKVILKNVQELFNDDPTFSGVSSVIVQMAGPAVTIGARLGINGINQEIPVFFKAS